MGSELNFPRLVHCSDTACLQLVHSYIYKHILEKTWIFGADQLCCDLLYAFEVNNGLSWNVQNIIKYFLLNSTVCRELCTITDFLNLWLVFLNYSR